MAVHDVEKNPRSAGILENNVLGPQRVVQFGDLLQLENHSVLVDQTFWRTTRAARIEDINGVGEGNTVVSQGVRVASSLEKFGYK